MTTDVLLEDLAAEVGSPERALALLDRVRAKVAEDALGRLVVSASAAIAVRDAARQEEDAHVWT